MARLPFLCLRLKHCGWYSKKNKKYLVIYMFTLCMWHVYSTMEGRQVTRA